MNQLESHLNIARSAFANFTDVAHKLAASEHIGLAIELVEEAVGSRDLSTLTAADNDDLVEQLKSILWRLENYGQRSSSPLSQPLMVITSDDEIESSQAPRKRVRDTNDGKVQCASGRFVCGRNKDQEDIVHHLRCRHWIDPSDGPYCGAHKKRHHKLCDCHPH
jgi:hypothetical protein